MKIIKLHEETLDQLIDDYSYQKNLSQIEREIILMILLSYTEKERNKIINMISSTTLPCASCHHDCYFNNIQPPNNCYKIIFAKDLITEIESDIEIFNNELPNNIKQTA